MIKNSFHEDSNQEEDLQEELNDRNEALEELTSILGGSSSCPAFAPTSTLPLIYSFSQI